MSQCSVPFADGSKLAYITNAVTTFASGVRTCVEVMMVVKSLVMVFEIIEVDAGRVLVSVL